MPKLGWKSPVTLKYISKWNPNKTMKENAKLIGIPYGCAAQLRMNHNLKSAKNNAEATKKVKLYASKTRGIDEVAKLSGISYAMAGIILRNNKLPYATRIQQRLLRTMKREIIEYLLKKGFTMEAVGRLYRVSRQRIEQLYKDLVYTK